MAAQPIRTTSSTATSTTNTTTTTTTVAVPATSSTAETATTAATRSTASIVRLSGLSIPTKPVVSSGPLCNPKSYKSQLLVGKSSPPIPSVSGKTPSIKRNHNNIPVTSINCVDKTGINIKLEAPSPTPGASSGTLNSGGGNAAAARLLDLGKRLLEATRDGETELVRQLVVDHGAPFTSDWLGTTALHFAAQNGFVEIAEILLNGGVNRDAKTKLERTALHLAAQSGSVRIVDMLVSNGADVNSRDMLRMTPLHWAVERGHFSVCERLLLAGADLAIKSKFQLTPIDIAKNSEFHDVIELFNNWLSVGGGSGVVCRVGRDNSASLSHPDQLHLNQQQQQQAFSLNQFSQDLNQLFNFGGGFSSDDSPLMAYHHPNMIASAANNKSTVFRNQQLHHSGQIVSATVGNQARQLSSSVSKNDHNESQEILDFDYQLALIDSATTANGRGGGSDAMVATDVSSLGATVESPEEKCIDLVGLDLEIEPEFFLRSNDSDDGDESDVGYLMKVVEELQKENKQLRQQVEQLSTTSP